MTTILDLSFCYSWNVFKLSKLSTLLITSETLSLLTCTLNLTLRIIWLVLCLMIRLVVKFCINWVEVSAAQEPDFFLLCSCEDVLLFSTNDSFFAHLRKRWLTDGFSLHLGCSLYCFSAYTTTRTTTIQENVNSWVFCDLFKIVKIWIGYT